MLEKLVAEFPAVPHHRHGLAESHNNLGILLGDLAKRPEADEQLRKALVIEEKLATEYPANPWYRRLLAVSHFSLGDLLWHAGKPPQAEEQYRKALAIQEKLVAGLPAAPTWRRELAASHHGLGFLLAGAGKRSDAEEQYRAALAIQQKLARDFPTVPLYQVDLGGSYCDFGMRLGQDDGGQPAETLTWFDKAIRTLTAVYAKGRELLRAKEFLRNSHCKKADKRQEYADRAMDLLQRAVKAGYNNAAHMAKDTDLDPIRGRDDFKNLIKDLAKKSPAKPEQKH